MSGYQDVPMTRRRAQLLEEYASKLADMLEAAPNDKDLAEWVQSKIDRAAAAIQSAYHYLDQDDESELEKAVGHKYTHRKLIGRDPKTNRARYRYYYAEHQGGGISRAKFEAGSAFRLTWKGRRGHFHIDRVEGDQVFITHDSRPDMEPVAIKADEIRALLRKQHSKAEQKHVEKRQREVEEIKRRAHRGGLGLALHRLRQAAAQAGVSLPEQYQRKPKKKRAKVAETMREVEGPRDQLKETAQQIIEEANQEHEERHDEHQEITRFELGEHVHTKTGAKLYTAKQTERVDRDEYFRRVEIAKKHNGRYERRYVRGFVFKTAEDARAFALEVEGAAQEAPETSAETVTPHDEHPGADNFETMPEVESAEDRTRGDLKSKQQALDLLRRSEQEDELKGRRRAKGAGAADKALMRAVREILKRPDPTQDLDERDRQRLRDSLFSLEEAQRPNKYMNAQRSKEKRQSARATIKEILDQQVRMISEALNPTPIPQTPAPEPTTPSTRPSSAYYGRATKKLVDQALSSEPTGFDPKRSGIDLPTKGDLREMLSQEQRLKRAKEDLISTGAPNFLGQKNPIRDIMYALHRYLHGPYGELEQERIREMERGLKIALRDSKGEELEQVKNETARFWREWGGEYKRLQDEFARGRTEGEALRNIRAFIPKRALTPEINQQLDQMERELDQKPVTGHDIAEWINTRDTNQATRDRQPTTPREQLTETTERVTSDQTAEQATTRATPRPSEATLRGSGELDETVRANLQDRAQFLTSGSEDTTKTGMRSKAQRAKDSELLLIYMRLQSDAQARLGPTAPPFNETHTRLMEYPGIGMNTALMTPYRAELREGIKDAIRELEQATSGRAESAQGLEAYRTLQDTFIGHLEEHLKTVSDRDLRAMRGAIDAEVARVEKLTKDERKRRDDTSAALDKIAEERAVITRKIEALKPRRDKDLDRKESRLNSAYSDQWAEARRARIAYIDKRRENTDPLVNKLSKPLKREENRRARRVQKSARPLITYRAQLIQTVERLTAA
jgi:hypothetical protein